MSGSNSFTARGCRFRSSTLYKGRFNDCRITTPIMDVTGDYDFINCEISGAGTVVHDQPGIAITIKNSRFDGTIELANATATLTTDTVADLIVTTSGAGVLTNWDDNGGSINTNGTTLASTQSNDAIREIAGDLDTAESNISTLQADLELVQNQIDLILTGNN